MLGSSIMLDVKYERNSKHITKNLDTSNDIEPGIIDDQASTTGNHAFLVGGCGLGPEDRIISLAGYWYCCQCGDGPININVSVKCPKCEHTKCSACRNA